MDITTILPEIVKSSPMAAIAIVALLLLYKVMEQKVALAKSFGEMQEAVAEREREVAEERVRREREVADERKQDKAILLEALDKNTCAMLELKQAIAANGYNHRSPK